MRLSGRATKSNTKDKDTLSQRGEYRAQRVLTHTMVDARSAKLSKELELHK